MSLIELKEAVKEYQTGDITVYALNHIDLAVKQGEIVMILGESGSGKSTLLNIMGGLDVLTSGEILLEGKSYAKFKDMEMSKLRRQKFGFIFQAYNLLPLLTVYENIIVPLLLDNQRAHRKDVEELSESLGIKEQLNKFPNQLSGGQQQRAAIVRALIHHPKVIFADEPTGNLDKDTGEQVMTCLINAVKKEGATLVMVTHNETLSSYADRVIRMENGREIKAEGQCGFQDGK